MREIILLNDNELILKIRNFPKVLDVPSKIYKYRIENNYEHMVSPYSELGCREASHSTCSDNICILKSSDMSTCRKSLIHICEVLGLSTLDTNTMLKQLISMRFDECDMEI